jgi:hypothetical protein
LFSNAANAANAVTKKNAVFFRPAWVKPCIVACYDNYNKPLGCDL